MPRRLRCADGGYVYHVLNRAVGRATLFESPGDYETFEAILHESWERSGMRLLAYVLMPNHWHLVIWPEHDGSLTTDLQWMTVTHVRRWHAMHQTAGTGPIYQGRYKSFPVQDDEHYWSVVRYVEQNPLRANLVERAQDWRWSSLWQRRQRKVVSWLTDAPLAQPERWVTRVNRPETDAELAALRQSVSKGTPYGGRVWQTQTAVRLGLQSTFRGRGRPRKEPEEY